MENVNEPKGESSVLIRGAVGAVIGAALGYAVFWGLVKVGIAAIIAPGALTGAIASRMSGRQSVEVGVIAAVVGAIATILSEWSLFPFIKDGSLTYFIAHLHQLRPATMLLGAAGIFCAFFYGRGR